MITPGSNCHSSGVIGMSGKSWRGVNWRSLIRWRKSTNFWFVGLKTRFWSLCLTVAIDWGSKFFLRKTARTSPRFSRLGPLMFLSVCNASPPWEIGSIWFCPLQSVEYGFWGSFDKQLKFFRFSIERGHRCCTCLGQFGNNVFIVMENCRIVFVCQLLKGQQNLVCFNCRRGVFTAAEWRLTGTAVLFLLSWRYTRGAVIDFIVNSCHVVAIANLFCSSCHHVVAVFT